MKSASGLRNPIPDSRIAGGFTLIELLVALVVFAALAAAAYGGLAQIARVRGALAAQQDRFAAITRAISLLERDLRQSVSRSVLGNAGEPEPALIGAPDSIEFTRLGFANPRAEPRSNLERVVYAIDNGKLRRARYAVLDRAPNSVLATRILVESVGQWHVRYLDRSTGAWRDTWPPAPLGEHLQTLPRAVEFNITFADLGEVRRVLELPSTLPPSALPSPTQTGPTPEHNTRVPTNPPDARGLR